MKENKNIERLFQEKFKEFEVSPPFESWNNIEARLNKKEKKKRVIPFWFKPAGIAAVLMVGFFLFINKKNDSSLITNDSDVLNNNTISNVEENLNENISTSSNDENYQKTIINNNLLEEELFDNDKNIVLENKSLIPSKKSIPNKNNSINSGVVLNKTNKTSDKRSVKNNVKFNNQSLTNNKAQKDLNVIDRNSEQLFFNQNNNNLINSNQSLVTNKDQNNLNKQNNKELIVNQNNNSSNDNQFVLNNIEEKNTIIDKSKIELLNSNNSLNNNGIVSENNLSLEGTDTLLIKNENIIANAIEDSILLASVETEENPLEKLLKEKLEGEDADEKEKEKRNKWAISTVASPVYFNSSSQGSPLDEQFKNNSKSYDNSLSVGLGLEYDFSKKFTVKTGLNTLAFSYTTNDVFYSTSLRSVDSNVENISRNSNGQNIILNSKNNLLNDLDLENIIENSKSSLNQRMSYLEIPLEVNYKLVDNKFGINIIGGLSTLILNENSVSLLNNGTEMEIGKANNLNNIHFSSNVGLGFKYTFWKSFQANFQPMFKYQINTFSNDSGNFKPYFVGLYSGISFSF